jgi:hypothetical protein
MPRISNARRPCIERYRDQSIGLADASIVVLAESLSPRELDSVTSFSARDRGVTVMVRITTDLPITCGPRSGPSGASAG